MDIKVEVGQVWHRPDVPVGRYKITKIVTDQSGRLVCHAAYAIGAIQWGHSSAFGGLKEDGTPDNWDKGWTLEGMSAPPIQASSLSSSTKKDEADFFRASSHPDLCSKCAAPLPCSYH
jgi:hypothetical protein